jgi:hypothetical protein
LRGPVGSRDLVGIVSWSSGPLSSRVKMICGGFTAITPISDHRAWIAEASERLLNYGDEPRQAREGARPSASYSWWFGR